MKRMKLGLIGLAALAALAFAPAAAQAACTVGNCWGAVAYGPGGAWGYAVNYPSRGAASGQAQRECGGRCQRVLTFHNSCGAYAVGYNGYGWGNAMSRGQAESLAMMECNRRSGGCSIRVWGCTSR